jgi:hypothetical protein
MAGNRMWNETVNANWIRARSSASKPNIGLPLSGNSGFRTRPAATAPTGIEYDALAFVLFSSAAWGICPVELSTNAVSGIDADQPTLKE